MPSYTVHWAIEIEADSAEEAALFARQEQLDPDSEALSFTVSSCDDQTDIDLIDIEDANEVTPQ